MNEELKIIIKAVTDTAQKNIKEVSNEVSRLSKSGKAASSKFSAALGAIGSAAKTAMKVTVTAVAAFATALIALGKSTQEYQKEQAKLNTAFLAAGASAEQAGKTYNDLYRFLGDSGKATEAAAHLAKLTTNERELAEWTTACQGIYATFGDSLPIEGLTEASNETAKVGTVTGVLADALNWAGVNEDSFNASLAACNSESERQALIRGTLNGLYSDAAMIYEQNNAELIAQNEAQAQLDATLGQLGKTLTPFLTKLTEIANVLLTALAPAIDVVCDALVWLVDVVSQAVSWITSFIGILTGSKNGAESVEDIAGGMDSAASGAGKLTGNIKNATAAAEKLKRTTAGFDELNKVGSGSVASSGGSSGGGSSGAIGGAIVLGDMGLTESFNSTGQSAEAFAKKITSVFDGIKTNLTEWASLFNPSIESWKTAFSGLQEPVSTSFTNVQGSINELSENTLKPFGAYLLEEFVPNITNSFSENIAPIFSDTMAFAIQQFSDDFDFMCQNIDRGVNDIVKPAMDTYQTVITDTLDIIGTEWEQSGEDLLTELAGVCQSFQDIWNNLYENIIKPVWDAIIGAIDTLWEEHLKGLWEEIVSFFSKVGECVMTIWNNFLGPIVNWLITVLAPIISNVITGIINWLGTFIGIIADVVGGVLRALGGLLDFITGVFSGDWEKAWQGICDFFGGIWDAIWGIVKGCINLIIDGINLLWGAVYGVVAGIINGIGGIAGAIGDIFGQDWHFSMPAEPPLIPKLAKGGIVDSATIAMIGERGKEAVVPLENNTEWMDILAERLASKNTTPSKIVLELDGKELGWANINSINSITAQTGALQLSLV